MSRPVQAAAPGLGPAEGQRRVLQAKWAHCTPELAAVGAPSWVLHFCTASGTAVSCVQEGGVKGSRPPTAACAVFTGHPATPVPAPLSAPARPLNPRERGGCPASRRCQAFPASRLTRQLPRGFPEGNTQVLQETATGSCLRSPGTGTRLALENCSLPWEGHKHI